MFLPMQISDVKCRFVIDTGSSVTIISSRLFDKVSMYCDLKLRPVNDSLKLEVADKGSLNVEGVATISFKVKSVEFTWEMYVADIQEDGLLGLDFLFENKYVLSAKSGLKLNGRKYACVTETNSLTSRVKASEDITIPVGNEVIIKGHVDNNGFLLSEGLISNDDQLTSPSFMIANTVVRLQSEQDKNVVPVRLFNVTDSEFSIKRGDFLGKIEAVDRIFTDETEAESHGKLPRDVFKVNRILVKDDLPEHIQDLFQRSSENLTSEESSKLCNLLKDNTSVFASSPNDLGKVTNVEHVIETGDARPIKQAARRVPKAFLDKEEEIINQQLRSGVIRESSSPWASPLVYVLKRDKTVRPCVDYRKLNAVTLKDAYPLPKINDCLDALGNAKYLTTLDLQSGYWQIGVRETDKQKTAFVTSRSGLYEYNNMAFGLCNAPGTFQRCMELIFRGLQWRTLLIYLDDVIIFSTTFDSHLERLSEVFQRLKQAGLKLKPSKCSLFRPEVSFLGHTITSNGIKPSREKVDLIRNWKRPQNLTQLRSFLGFCSYYRRYIRNFSKIASPLNCLLEAGQSFDWTCDCEEAFLELRNVLTGDEVMALPNDTGLFVLDTDASGRGIGAVLSQIQYCETAGKEIERPISFASKTMTKSQRNYCVTKKEMLAVVTFVQHFKQYLMGRKFVIRTDHSALRWVMSFKEPENQMARWLEILSQYDFSIIHRKGRKHENADFMSRLACDPVECECYDGQSILSDLPCAGCKECRKRHEQWSSFMETEDIVHHRINTVHVNRVRSDCYNNAVLSKLSVLGRVFLMCFVSLFLSSVHVVRRSYSNVCWFVSLGWYGVNSQPEDDVSIDRLRSSTGYVRLLNTAAGSSTNKDNNVGSLRFKTPSYMRGYSPKDLTRMQKNDPEVGFVIKWLEKGAERPGREEVASRSPFVRHLWLLWTQLVIIDGVCYKRWYPKLKGQVFHQLIVPRSMRKELLEDAHNSKFGGHLGVRRVVDKLKLNFYWFRMKESVRIWVQNCVVCGARKRPKRKAKAQLGSYVTGAPMDRIQMDISGPFPCTERNNRYILVIQCQFSKWVEAYAIKNQLTTTIAEIMVNEFFSRFGCPLEIHTDQGSNFNSSLFKEVCKLLNIYKTRTTPYRPCSNGLVERFNQTLNNMIASYVDKNQGDWDVNISLLTSAYRASVHDSTGFTPNMVMLGREVNQPSMLKFGIISDGNNDNESSYVQRLYDNMFKVHEIVRENLSKSIQRQKNDYDSRLAYKAYNVGDLVYFLDISRKVGLSPKLRSDPWKGPFVITKKLSDLLYEIRGEARKKVRVIHHDRLKPYTSDILPFWVSPIQQSLVQTSAEVEEQQIIENVSLPITQVAGGLSRPKRNVNPPKRLTY